MTTRTWKYWILAVLFVGLAPAASFGALAAHGPINPTNGGPLWIQDTSGQTLELNLDFVHGISAPPVVGNAFSQQAGFGEEGFYYTCDALMPLASGGQALLVQAVEFAWLPGPAPAAGEQFIFQRIRIRVDCPVAGTYTVTTPYVTKVYNVVTPGVRAINDTVDLGGAPPTFPGLLGGPIGPFCRPDPANAANFTAPNVPVPTLPAPGFIGTALSEVTIVGSPLGTNFFRVAGPAGSNLGGAGINTVTQTLFTVTGKFFAGNPLTLQAVMSGDQMVPPVVSNALGVVDLNINAAQTILTFTTNILPLPATSIQKIEVRFGGALTAPGPVLFTLFDSALNGTFTSPLNSIITAANFTPPAVGQAGPASFAEAVTAIMSGEASIVVSTVQNPAGEIRGQLLTAGAPVPVVGTRATLTAGAFGVGTLDVFAAAVPGATTSVVVGAAPAVPLVNNGQGRAFARIAVPSAAALPANITLRSARVGSADTVLIVPVSDTVNITLARFLTGVNILQVAAASSDLFHNPVLTADGFGVMPGGALSATAATPPSTVTVTSARGGTATLPVLIIGPAVDGAAGVAPATLPPITPVIAGPSGTLPNQPNPPTFTWSLDVQPDRIATAYDLDIFGTPVQEVVGNIFTPAAPMQTGKFFFFRVRAKNAVGVSAFSPYKLFMIQPLVIGTPVVVGPKGAQPNQPNPPVFTWQAANNAISYEVEIFGGGGGAVGNVTTFTPAAPIPTGAFKFWRVRGRNGGDAGPWSAFNLFSVTPLVISTPNQLTPIGTQPALPNPPVFTWEASASGNATGYEVDIFGVGVSTVGNVTTFTPAAPLTPGTKFWRIRARNGGDASPWSSYKVFTLPAQPI